MKKFSLIILLILAGNLLVSSQVRGRPEPTPLSPGQRSTDQAVRQANDINRRSNELKNVENFPVRNNGQNKIFRNAIKPLYRKSSKKELKLLAPDEGFEKAHQSFLKNKNSGLIKLVRDRGCADSVKIVQASRDCSVYTMPGAGSSYSFRIEDYRLKNLGDLNFSGKNFEALGVLLHGVMINLGDVPIEKVDENSPAFQYIRDFKPAEDFKQAADFAMKLQKGIEANGFTYASILPVQENSTYVLRSIAYRGLSVRTIEGIAFNELEFDKRKDITVVFRILQKTDDNVTILWKELDDRKSPLLEIGN